MEIKTKGIRELIISQGNGNTGIHFAPVLFFVLRINITFRVVLINMRFIDI